MFKAALQQVQFQFIVASIFMQKDITWNIDMFSHSNLTYITQKDIADPHANMSFLVADHTGCRGTGGHNDRTTSWESNSSAR